MNTQAQVRRDMAALRTDLLQSGIDHQELVRRQALRSLIDIVFDIAVVAAATAACATIGLWLTPLAVLIIGNRQRSLGDILHDGSHGNLHARRDVNDLIVRILLAPLCFVSLTSYRAEHSRHHAHLGNAEADPDYIPSRRLAESWHARYLSLVVDARTWWASFAAHLGASGVHPGARLTIAAWWFALGAAIACAAGIESLILFAGLWLLARATSFHLITSFREMCDHYGLSPGGIYSYARDVVAPSPWAWLMHPRDKGMHLTHHLMPCVPYYRLQDAQRAICTLRSYRTGAHTHNGYDFMGTAPTAVFPTLACA